MRDMVITPQVNTAIYSCHSAFILIFLLFFYPLPFLLQPKPSHILPCTLHNLAMGVQTDPEGSLWRDPPRYWEQIVWPAYVDAHKDMFEDGDVEHGKVNPSFKGQRLLVIEGMDESMDRMVEECCELVKDAL